MSEKLQYLSALSKVTLRRRQWNCQSWS